ncbi:MAG: hypothetical protein HOP28_11415 [Gemmatimonadales bacterium]|nr:hypothetical protein [Gemmatimonadales bacterium]
MVREDQRLLAQGLKQRFGDVDVILEWAALSNQRDTYSPRVDIAVGPFAIDTRHEAQYDHLEHMHHDFLFRLHAAFAQNVATLDHDGVSDLESMSNLNRNARCFLAIEVEGSGSRKHTLGGAVNAAALGRIGISVACSNGELKKLLRMRRYLRFLQAAGKNTFDTMNLLVVTREQFARVLQVDLVGV